MRHRKKTAMTTPVNDKPVLAKKLAAESSDSSDEELPKVTPKKVAIKKPASSSSDSSDEEVPKLTAKKLVIKKPASSSSESEDEPPKKIVLKPKTGQKRARKESSSCNEEIGSKEVAVIDTPVRQPAAKRKRQSSPFRRVKSEEITLLDDRLGDRMATDCVGGVIGWGIKAHEQLRSVKGKKFTHEKNKKKRGSYSGGFIETGVNSIKFADDIW